MCVGVRIRRVLWTWHIKQGKAYAYISRHMLCWYVFCILEEKEVFCCINILLEKATNDTTAKACIQSVVSLKVILATFHFFKNNKLHSELERMARKYFKISHNGVCLESKWTLWYRFNFKHCNLNKKLKYIHIIKLFLPYSWNVVS